MVSPCVRTLGGSKTSKGGGAEPPRAPNGLEMVRPSCVNLRLTKSFDRTLSSIPGVFTITMLEVHKNATTRICGETSCPFSSEVGCRVCRELRVAKEQRTPKQTDSVQCLILDYYMTLEADVGLGRRALTPRKRDITTEKLFNIECA